MANRSLKIRRVGNSNVMTLPRELEKIGFIEGQEVVYIPTRTGEVLLIPAERLNSYIDSLGQRVVEENREAIGILVAHDRDEVGVEPPEA
jgi:antitoxin component of MazEF toxin-antitoxin module